MTVSEHLKTFLTDRGMSEASAASFSDFSTLILIFLISVVVYYITKFIINRLLKKLIRRSASKWDDHLYEARVFTRLALLIPAIILAMTVESSIELYPVAIKYILLGINVYITFVLILAVISFLNAVQRIYRDFEGSSAKPIKSYIQIGKIIVLVIGGIVMISVLVGKSPLSLLAGLGAMSAVLMLIFKDSILGFVAGIQLSGNRSLQMGDWITVPKFNTDGTVIDISLVTVKVRNFDNSVSMVPTYSLIIDSFINWRSFEEAGGRRIKRYFLVDVGTVFPLSEELLSSLRARGYAVDEFYNKEDKVTNLGLFRMYLAHRLRQEPLINRETTLMIRVLQPAENGLPVEIYTFYNSPDWVAYENYQSSFMEHLFASLPDFKLRAFQRAGNVASGSETCLKKNEI